MKFSNIYEDDERATAYSKLAFPGTYYLAFRDLPAIFSEHVSGKRALDFGCGTGRSARFLDSLGFQTTGIDISGEMVQIAREINPKGDYRLEILKTKRYFFLCGVATNRIKRLYTHPGPAKTFEETPRWIGFENLPPAVKQERARGSVHNPGILADPQFEPRCMCC